MTTAGNEAALLPTRSLRWKETAQRVGARYEPGDFWSPERLVLASPPWTLTVHTESIVAPLTVVGADYLSRADLRVTLLRGEFRRHWPGIDLAPVDVGGPGFFSQVQVTSTSSALPHALFARPGLRLKLLRFPHLALELKRGRLRLGVAGVVEDPEALIELLSIGVEVLQSLHAAV
jgi:hypothetical protein